MVIIFSEKAAYPSIARRASAQSAHPTKRQVDGILPPTSEFSGNGARTRTAESEDWPCEGRPVSVARTSLSSDPSNFLPHALTRKPPLKVGKLVGG